MQITKGLQQQQPVLFDDKEFISIYLHVFLFA